MPPVGFEPTISAFERAKTVHALDDAATEIGPGLGLVFYTEDGGDMFPRKLS
jgi:hypothetical protein